jgi:hypothetical protein
VLELLFRKGEVLPIETRLRFGVPRRHKLGQETLANFGKRRTNARRGLCLARLIQRIFHDDCRDGSFRFGAAAERKQAQGPILLDGFAIGRLGGTHRVEHRERFVVAGGRVEIACGRQRTRI